MSPLHPNRTKFLATAAAVALLGSGQPLKAESEGIRFNVLTPVEVHLTGTSTLHNWDCAGDRLDLATRINLTRDTFETAVAATWEEKLPLPVEFLNNGKINGTPLVAKVPIESLECNRSRMQRDLRETVKFDDHPVIEYELEALRETGFEDRDRDTLKLSVTGKLTVAGVTRPVDHQVAIKRLDHDTFEVRGKLDLKMSWFDMEPPTALFGLLKAHNEFQVTFHFQARIQDNETDAGR